jgi:hypothetical protein
MTRGNVLTRAASGILGATKVLLEQRGVVVDGGGNVLTHGEATR